jgi:hypothetical protein
MLKGLGFHHELEIGSVFFERKLSENVDLN